MTLVQPYLGLAVHEKPLVGAGWLPQYDWCFDYAFMSYSEHNGFKSGVCTPVHCMILEIQLLLLVFH